jgi:outer membrane lipoprotein-sorting protein
MQKKRFVLFISLLLTGFFCSPTVSTNAGDPATITAREIALKSREKRFPDNSVMDITMVLINKRGNKRERKIETKRKTSTDGEAKSVAFFLSPADVKGTSFLVWEHKDQDNDVFIYLPALKKIRRIASDQKNQSFMGSDFSYADMENEDVDDAIHKILAEELWEEKACWVIESIPKPESDSEYGRSVTWVAKENFIPEKVELYDKKGNLYKVMDVLRAGSVGKEILPLDFTMENVQKNHKTRIILNNVKLDQTIPDSEFTQRAMERR